MFILSWLVRSSLCFIIRTYESRRPIMNRGAFDARWRELFVPEVAPVDYGQREVERSLYPR